MAATLTNFVSFFLVLSALSTVSDATPDQLEHPFTRETSVAHTNIQAIVRRSRLVCQVISVTVSVLTVDGVTSIQTLDPPTQVANPTFVPVVETIAGGSTIENPTGGTQSPPLSVPIQPAPPVISTTGGATDIPITLPDQPLPTESSEPTLPTVGPAPDSPTTNGSPNAGNSATPGELTTNTEPNIPITIPLIKTENPPPPGSFAPATTATTQNGPINVPPSTPSTVDPPPPTTHLYPVNGATGMTTVSPSISPTVDPPPTTNPNPVNGAAGLTTVSPPTDVPITIPAHCPPHGCPSSLTVIRITDTTMPSTPGGSDTTTPVTRTAGPAPMFKYLARDIEVVESTICFWEPDDPEPTGSGPSMLTAPDPTADFTSGITETILISGSTVLTQTDPIASSQDTSGGSIETGSAQSTSVNSTFSLFAITTSSTSTGAPTLILDWPTTTTIPRSTGSRRKSSSVWLGVAICFVMIRGWL